MGGRQVRRREDRQDGQEPRHRQKVSQKKLVIPGHVAGLSGEVEEELPEWKIMVGPRDAVDIPNYIKNVWGA